MSLREYMKRLMGNDSSLTCVKLDRIRMGVTEGIVFAAAIKINSFLNSLSLCGNDGIREEGVIAFAVALKENTSLTSLNMGHTALKKNSTLTRLDLSYNGIG